VGTLAQIVVSSFGLGRRRWRTWFGLYLDEKKSSSSASSLYSSRVQKERGRNPYLIALDTIIIIVLSVSFIGSY